MSSFRNNSSETENSSSDDEIKLSRQDIFTSKSVLNKGNNVNQGASSSFLKKNEVSIYLYIPIYVFIFL